MVEQVSSLKTDVKYKDTPIGKIPVDWEVVRLGDVCDIIGGSTPSTKRKEYWVGHIPFATPTDITSLRGREISITKESITSEGLSSCGARLLPVGSILLTSRATLGACAINTKSMATNQGFASLVCGEKAYNWFIFYKMISLKRELQTLGSGSTFKEVSKGNIRSLFLAIPSPPEQKKIAEILTTIDDAIEKTTQIIDKTKELKKGLMQRLLTRGIGHKKFKKTEIGEIPVDWEVKRLKDLFIGKPEYGANTSAIDKADHLPRYIRITDITEDGKLLDSTWQSIERIFAENYMLKEGDFLFARSGATVGKTYLYKKNGDCAFAGYLIKFKLNRIIFSPDFLFHFTHSQNYYNWVKGVLRAGAQPNINAKEYSNMKVPSPPIKEQKRIVSILNSIDDQIEKELNHRDQLNLLKKGLMQVLLTGKLRVIV